MSAPSSVSLRSELVTRLRTAGCVFAEDEADLLLSVTSDPARLGSMVERRAAGLPLEHVVGWASFRGLRVAVDPGVFVPRRRTEFLAQQATQLARTARPTVVDLCCGSGAVGLALLAELERVDLHAVDIDPAAVCCARRNLADGHVYEGDLYAALPTRLRGAVDVLVACAPYVPTGAIELMPAEARIHEPRVALDGGVDGLDVVRRVAGEAPLWLVPGGHLLVETSAGQAEGAGEILAAAGLEARIATCEERNATVLIGRGP